MLPDGFRFEPYVDGPCLRVGDEVVATACPARDEPGAPWRICLAPRKPPRFVFCPDEEACLRYMEAWARKWEVEIRERCDRPSLEFAHLRQTGQTPAEPQYPRRRKRRR